MPDDAIQFRPNDTTPDKLRPHQDVKYRITMKNSGDTTWTRQDDYELRPAPNSDDELWDEDRARLPAGVRVEPDGFHTFDVEIRAPRKVGEYEFQAQMARRREYFGRKTDKVDVTVEERK